MPSVAMGHAIVREILALRHALGLPNEATTEPVPLSRRSSYQSALAEAYEETGVDLGTSRVRVGFTRGHLLEVVVQVPRDVTAHGDALQIAAEIFLEEAVGTALLDEWVASVSVDRIARTKGLVALQSPGDAAATSPLESAAPLIERGVNAVRVGLPESLLEKVPEEGWTALEIPPMDEGIQAEREFASTCFPEALKSALEGLPFSSTRFTKGAEIFAWLTWQGSIAHRSPAERLQTRTHVERTLKEGGGKTTWIFAGSGFGRRRDYVDLWTSPSREVLEKLVRSVGSLVGPVELGFYDSALRDYGFGWQP